MGDTNFISFQELTTSTADKIIEMLNNDGEIVITSNGKPKALMIQVDENDFENILALLNQVKWINTLNN
jgi:PHD/YefM family antitoxin component YafN of YafNO toxin-antitoxin module